MQAIVYHRYGTPDVLTLEEIPKPVPAAEEVVIAVRAASVNPYDWHFLHGAPKFIRLFTGIGKPKFPGLGADMAGVVESVGSQVTRFQAGDPVFGTGKGAFAQFACAPAKNLARKLDGISFAQAASVPIAALTALQGLRDSGQLKAGQTVLINGAAGGVGTFAVQIARHLGARVTGVCSTHNLELVRALGAEDAIDYTRQDFVQSATRYNVLFDLVGNRSLSECRQVLHPRGIFVGCGGGGPEKGSGELLGMMAGRAALSPFVR